MNAYAVAGWENFLVAEVGAAAALSGLIFVAVSINLSRILAFPSLPGRAGQTIATLVAVLVAATVLLVPGQSPTAAGAELLGVATTSWTLTTLVQLRSIYRREEKVVGRVVFNGVLIQTATLPFVVAGLSLLLHAGGGLYWLVPGVVFSVVAGTFNAWVLLVEIMR